MTLAYWCVFVAMFIPWLCAAYAKKTGGFRGRDNHNPREFLANTQGAAARAHAAQQNGFEIFAPFAAAVLIAHNGDADQSSINFWAVLFVCSRLLYSWLYVQDWALLRSVVWFAGLLCIVALFVAAI